MNISPISFQTPNFKSNKRSVFDSQGKFLYKTTTYFFRDDLEWTGFLNCIRNKYLHTPKVNFIIEGCSNGAECYTCIMKLLVNLAPKEAEKFLPIFASDIDKDNIQHAINGENIGIQSYDLYRVNYHTQNKLNEYMNFVAPTNKEYFMSLRPKQILRNYVKFKQGDILKNVDSMPNNNTILFCRNLWLYLDEAKREELAYKLGQKFDSTSLVVIGAFDTGAREALIHNGFIELGTTNVFSKPSYRDSRQF